MNTRTITSLDVSLSLKMIRETLCVSQTGINLLGASNAATHIARLQKLIDFIDLLRPLGPDGKHGNLHTAFCGCPDKDKYLEQ